MATTTLPMEKPCNYCGKETWGDDKSKPHITLGLGAGYSSVAALYFCCDCFELIAGPEYSARLMDQFISKRISGVYNKKLEKALTELQETLRDKHGL